MNMTDYKQLTKDIRHLTNLREHTVETALALGWFDTGTPALQAARAWQQRLPDIITGVTEVPATGIGEERIEELRVATWVAANLMPFVITKGYNLRFVLNEAKRRMTVRFDCPDQNEPVTIRFDWDTFVGWLAEPLAAGMETLNRTGVLLPSDCWMALVAEGKAVALTAPQMALIGSWLAGTLDSEDFHRHIGMEVSYE